MAITVYANGLSVVFQKDGLVTPATAPDVCKTPMPHPVPIPYGNIAMHADLILGSKRTRISRVPLATGASLICRTNGDQGGTAGGGVMSNMIMGMMKWLTSSLDVLCEGQGVARFSDITMHNGNSYNTLGRTTGVPRPAGPPGPPLAEHEDPVQLYAVEVTVVGEDQRPLARQDVELVKAEGQVLSARTTRQGTVRFDRLEAGAYELSLYKLDEAAWSIESQASLPSRLVGGSPVTFGPPEPREEPPSQHIVEQGDCISSIALTYGFAPDTIADHNAALADLRPNLNILYPGDVVLLPPRTYGSISVSLDTAYTLKRVGVPELLEIRFLDDEGNARAGLSYVARVYSSARAIEDFEGSLDGDGFLRIAISPDANRVKITLSPGGADEEEHIYDLGALDPIDTISGLQGRLLALGYECGGVTGEMDGLTQNALECFQLAHDISEVGTYGEETKDVLRSLHLS